MIIVIFLLISFLINFRISLINSILSYKTNRCIERFNYVRSSITKIEKNHRCKHSEKMDYLMFRIALIALMMMLQKFADVSMNVCNR